MNNNEQIESMIKQIIEIEKQSIKKKFDEISGIGEKFSKTKADTAAVNQILSLLEVQKGGDQ